MSIAGFLTLAGIFAAIMMVYYVSGRYIKKLPPKTIKAVNTAGFYAAIGGGILWYLSGRNEFMAATLAGVVAYFLFYDYVEKPAEPGPGNEGGGKNY